MFTWENVKNPSEVKTYAFDWSDELGAGETIQSCSSSFVSGSDAGLTIVQSNQFSGVFSYVKVSGGTAGLTGAIRGEIVTNIGTYAVVGLLQLVAEDDPAQNDLATLKADLIKLREARISMLTGQQVKEVWREGRRIAYNVGSLSDINKAIAEYENLIAVKEAEAAATTVKPRFRALRPRFR